MIKRFLNDESGQGMTEYILIVALIAIVAIASIKIFGSQISSMFKRAAGKLETEAGSELD
ncbi:MAG: Flp family type IVb pilin [bacterium]|nr:Flp family type IVb pilin [bacterium]